MGRATVRGGFDTWAGSGKPGAEHPRGAALKVRNGEQESYLYFRNPAPRGATITSATLTLRARGAQATHTVTVRPVDGSWKAGKLNWNNRPGVKGTGVSKSTGALTNGEKVEFDVTAALQAMSNGERNFGFRIVTNASATRQFHSLNANRFKPFLVVTWSDKPDVPTSLEPAGGVISTAFPLLEFDYTDVSGSTELASVHVQVFPTEDETGTPLHDSGEYATTVPEYDLATSGFAGIAPGQTVYWRVRVKDEAGLWSGWSELSDITRTAKGTLTITSPTDNGTVLEPTPPVTWTFTGTQTAYQVRIISADGVVLYNSGKRGGTDTVHNIPAKVIKNGDDVYTVNVRVWDDEERVAAAGDPPYIGASHDFTMDSDALTTGVTGLTATVEPDSPKVVLSWTRASVPDYYVVYRDDEVIYADLEDIDIDGTTHGFLDAGAAPHRQHVYSVRAVTNGKQSAEGTTVTAITYPVGVWLIDPVNRIEVAIAGDDEGSWEMPDEAGVYTPLGSTEAIRVVSGLRGYEGSLSGLLIGDWHGMTFDEMQDALFAMKSNPAQALRLVAGDVNIPVVIGNIGIAPRPSTRKGVITKAVSFDFWQVGELPFEPRL